MILIRLLLGYFRVTAGLLGNLDRKNDRVTRFELKVTLGNPRVTRLRLPFQLLIMKGLELKMTIGNLSNPIPESTPLLLEETDEFY